MLLSDLRLCTRGRQCRHLRHHIEPSARHLRAVRSHPDWRTDPDPVVDFISSMTGNYFMSRAQNSPQGTRALPTPWVLRAPARSCGQVRAVGLHYGEGPCAAFGSTDVRVQRHEDAKELRLGTDQDATAPQGRRSSRRTQGPPGYRPPPMRQRVPLEPGVEYTVVKRSSPAEAKPRMLTICSPRNAYVVDGSPGGVATRVEDGLGG